MFGVFEFNHIEMGHATTERPSPKTEEHVKAWARGVWRGEHVFLNDDLPQCVINRPTSDDVKHVLMLARKVAARKGTWARQNIDSVGYRAEANDYWEDDREFEVAAQTLVEQMECYCDSVHMQKCN